MRERAHTPDNEQPAEEVFVEYLARRRAGTAESIDALIEQHPALEPELRRLHADLIALEQLREQIADEPPGGELHHLLDDLRSPRSFAARFELIGEIGAGGQGEVREAREVALQRTVAIKGLHRTEDDGTLAGDSGLARFLAEAQITAQLDHPGIVAVHELGLDDEGRPYFTMSRVRGRELSLVFRSSREGAPDWPLVRCVSLLQSVCDTMTFAHSRGVVHRDLKPANVMVGSFGEVFVVDWGVARVESAEPRRTGSPAVQTVRDSGAARRDPLLATLASERVGTVFYMAPELLDPDRSESNAAADVYAVGAMLYELLTGRPPFWTERAGATQAAVLERLRSGGPTSLGHSAPHAPPELVSICERAMAREPSDRYPDFAALGADLRAFLEGHVVAAHESGPLAGLFKWITRNRRLAAALSTAIVVTLAGAIAVAVVAERARDRLDLQADLFRLPYLEERARDLWPESPELVPAFELWIETAETLAGRLELHRAELRSVRLEARSAEPARLESALDASRSWRFDTPADQLRHDTLAEMVARLEAFSAPRTGLLDELRARLTWARGVHGLTIQSQAVGWGQTRDVLAAPQSPYGPEFELVPQLGLVPLGRDARSALLEFAFPRSGAIPERDASRELVMNGETALVFVLIPAGDFLMGAQTTDPTAAGYDALAHDVEGPPHSVLLDAFLVSKYELTQGQWRRLTGAEPSFIRADAEGGSPDLHPVEGVSWQECVDVLARFGLTLPTEAQWEFAARAGRAGPFFGTADARTLAGRVNLADATVSAADLGWPQARGMEWLDDGFIRHAPVGSFQANRFGLHDTLGNVWEWCLDEPGDYASPYHPGTGLRVAQDEHNRVARGGGFINNAAYARTTIRDMGRSRNFDSSYHGLRPVAPIRVEQR